MNKEHNSHQLIVIYLRNPTLSKLPGKCVRHVDHRVQNDFGRPCRTVLRAHTPRSDVGRPCRTVLRAHSPHSDPARELPPDNRLLLAEIDPTG
jgi:hypothetical protein